MRAALLLVPFGVLLAARSRSTRIAAVPSLPSSPRSSSSPEPFGDRRRLHTLEGLIPEVRPHFEALIHEARSRGLPAQIVSALRTCEEQGNLAGTKARRSWHTLGRAVDLEFAGASSADYEALGTWWEKRGGVWGGRWTELYPVAPCGPPDRTTGDPCHFQWTPGTERVPASVWPPELGCVEVAQRYLATHGGAWTPLEGWRA
jgi:hypothetical protein